jgi:hypothetical protein
VHTDAWPGTSARRASGEATLQLQPDTPPPAKGSKREPEAPPLRALSHTLQDASAISGLSVPTLRRRGKDGTLRLFRCGGRTLVDGASLRGMLGTE